jgi:hypothetical protein
MGRLGDLARGGETVTAARLVRDRPLIAELQAALVRAGLLDPPGDGFLGPATQWALAAFCRLAGTPFEGGLSPATAAALLAPEALLPVRPGPDLAGRVAAALLRRGDWLCRHPDCVNIVYVEGMDPEGRPTPRRPDFFDDLRLLLRIGPDGRPVIPGAWEATTAPGRPAVEGPAEPEGAPRLSRGQHRAWVIGRTAIGTELEQEALVQAVPVTVTRDADRNFRRAGDPPETDLYVLDQHGALDASRKHVGGTGAGCLVGRAQDGHAAFMAALRSDPRWGANTAHLFTTSVIGAEELSG